MTFKKIKDITLLFFIKLIYFYDYITTNSETGEIYVLTYGTILIAIKLIFDACYNFYYTVNFVPKRLVIGMYYLWYDPLKPNKTLILISMAFIWLSLDIFLNSEKTEYKGV